MSERVTFGLTLANRGVVFGVTTATELIDLAVAAEQTGLFRSVYVGDSLLGNPRLESVALLSAIAARTQRVRLGTACMASFPLRDPILLATQWASLDQLSNGRAQLVVCTGSIPRDSELAAYGITRGDRVSRLIESIKVLKVLWTEDQASFEGKHFKFENISIGLKTPQQPRPPIFISSNARGDPALVDRTLRRVALHADGWMTTIITPDPIPAFVERWGRILEHAQ